MAKVDKVEKKDQNILASQNDQMQNFLYHLDWILIRHHKAHLNAQK